MQENDLKSEVKSVCISFEIEYCLCNESKALNFCQTFLVPTYCNLTKFLSFSLTVSSIGFSGTM